MRITRMLAFLHIRCNHLLYYFFNQWRRNSITNLNYLLFNTTTHFIIGWKSLNLFQLIRQQHSQITPRRILYRYKEPRLMVITTYNCFCCLSYIYNLTMNRTNAFAKRKQIIMLFLLIF